MGLEAVELLRILNAFTMAHADTRPPDPVMERL